MKIKGVFCCIQNRSVGFENQEDGNCEFAHRGNIQLFDEVKIIKNKFRPLY